MGFRHRGGGAISLKSTHASTRARIQARTHARTHPCTHARARAASAAAAMVASLLDQPSPAPIPGQVSVPGQMLALDKLQRNLDTKKAELAVVTTELRDKVGMWIGH